MIIEDRIKLAGFVPAFEVVRKGIVIKHWQGRKNNLILTSGKDVVLRGTFGILNLFTNGKIGTSPTAPAPSQTGLQTFHKFTNSIYAGAGANGQSWNLATGTLSLWRTFEFSAEIAPVTIYEFGIYGSTGDAKTFNRLLFPVPVDLASGDQLRVTYQLDVTFTPFNISTSNPLITGWDTTGDYRLNINSLAVQGQKGLVLGGNIESDGDIQHNGELNYDDSRLVALTGRRYTTVYNNDTSGTICVGAVPIASWPAFGTLVTRTPGTNWATFPSAPTWGTYTDGQGYIDYTFNLNPATWTTDQTIAWAEFDGILMRFNTPQTKATTHRLSVTRRCTLT